MGPEDAPYYRSKDVKRLLLKQIARFNKVYQVELLIFCLYNQISSILVYRGLYIYLRH